MAAFETTRALNNSRTFGAVLSRFHAAFVASIVSWNDARVTRNALCKLTLRELDDLGLVPGDIEDIAQGNYRR